MVAQEQDVEHMDIAVDPEDRAAYELARMRHSTAHLMAEAVQEVFPEAKFGIGPAIENGFYYDFDLPRALTPDDLKEIEKRMIKHKNKNEVFERKEVSREEAMEIFKNNPYKLELIANFPEGEVISTYQQGDFLDLCRGPHVESTKEIGPFKLQSVAGAYWRGDENRPMLQRIYGTAFNSKEELDDYLHKLEEAAKRDHRKLGKELDLFSVNEEIGPGLILWHPKGALIRYLIEQFEQQEQLKRGYDLVYTPHIASEKIYKTSGHLETYGENMYSPMSIEEVDYYLKPMNCPGHIAIYNNGIHSYRELPIRLAELGTVYRFERSGTLHGMLRVRGFTQDDSHIFCTHEQVAGEVGGVIDLALHMADVFGYGLEVYLCTKPAKAIGSDEIWDEATETLRQALESRGMKYKIDAGEGAFYGPKIDIKWLDALGRAWTGPTIQVDFNLPERFDVNYVAEDGGRHRAAMIHRTLLGSMERFVGGLIEHYAGAFPAWLAPVQASIITVTDDQIPFAKQVEQRLKDAGIRAELSSGSGRMQAKIRQAQLQKIPYMLVIGAREAEADSVAVRLRTGDDLGAMTVSAFEEMIRPVIETKSLDLVQPRAVIG
ncbi:MAG: threonine--tRNA ligase [Thermomicrobiales bacterium]|nr:threonine--tRNA ligase [Thermomicrobiales bacterium]